MNTSRSKLYHWVILLQGHPPVSPNLPPIAGALSWVREMLARVTKPMDTFKNNSILMHSVVSHIITTLCDTNYYFKF